MDKEIEKQEKEFWEEHQDPIKKDFVEKYSSHYNYIISSQESFVEWARKNCKYVNSVVNEKGAILIFFDDFYDNYLNRVEAYNTYNVEKSKIKECYKRITLHVYAKNLYSLFTNDKERQNKWKELLVKGREFGVNLHLMGRVTQQQE